MATEEIVQRAFRDVAAEAGDEDGGSLARSNETDKTGLVARWEAFPLGTARDVRVWAAEVAQTGQGQEGAPRQRQTQEQVQSSAALQGSAVHVAQEKHGGVIDESRVSRETTWHALSKGIELPDEFKHRFLW